MFNIILIYVVPTSEDRKRHIVRCWPMYYFSTGMSMCRLLAIEYMSTCYMFNYLTAVL